MGHHRLRSEGVDRPEVTGPWSLGPGPETIEEERQAKWRQLLVVAGGKEMTAGRWGRGARGRGRRAGLRSRAGLGPPGGAAAPRGGARPLTGNETARSGLERRRKRRATCPKAASGFSSARDVGWGKVAMGGA
jgi:hypothetical protein